MAAAGPNNFMSSVSDNRGSLREKGECKKIHLNPNPEQGRNSYSEIGGQRKKCHRRNFGLIYSAKKFQKGGHERHSCPPPSFSPLMLSVMHMDIL